MKRLALLLLLPLFFLSSCSLSPEPLIGITMAYWEGKYSIDKSYVDAIRDNGGRVRIIPCSEDESLLRRELKELDGIVFIGGRDYFPEWYGKEMHASMTLMDSHRARFDSLFMHLALESGKPVLGICAGEQLMNIATGGKLIRDIPGHRGVEHGITIVPGSRMALLYGTEMTVNSWHHQCVEAPFLHPDFQVTAWSADSIVEAIEHRGDQWIMGTQFHPEKFPRAERDKFFKLFLRETKR